MARMIEGVGRWKHVVCYVVVEKMRSKKLTEEEAGGIRAITSRVRKLSRANRDFPAEGQILENNLSDCTQ